jgi:hypothetical protein
LVIRLYFCLEKCFFSEYYQIYDGKLCICYEWLPVIDKLRTNKEEIVRTMKKIGFLEKDLFIVINKFSN